MSHVSHAFDDLILDRDIRIRLLQICHITSESPRRNSLLKQLVQLFQAPPFRLRDAQEDKHREDGVAAAPDVAILGTPVEGFRVDEVRRAVGDQPHEDEVGALREADGVGAEFLRRGFCFDGPEDGALADVVDPGVGDAQAEEGLPAAGEPLAETVLVYR